MNTKHTPGTWEAINVDGYGDWGVYVESDETAVDLTICHVCNESHWHPEKGYAKANARLIAAAPELLESCKRLVGSLGVMVTDKDNDGDIIFARAAIAKATGGAQ